MLKQGQDRNQLQVLSLELLVAEDSLVRLIDAFVDVYVCPTGELLRPNEKWYVKNNGRYRKSYRVRHFKLPFKVCNSCRYRLECAGEANLKNSKGRYVERSEYQEYIDENVERVKLNKELYRKRQQIIEHPFGTIKRQWGYDYTLLKTKKKVSGEFALIFTVYNLRRAVSILGMEELTKRLRKAFVLLKRRTGGVLSLFKPQLVTKEFLNDQYPFLRSIQQRSGAYK